MYFHDHPILTCEEVGVWRSSRSRPPPDSPHTRGGDSSLQGGGAGPTLCVAQPTLAVYLSLLPAMLPGRRLFVMLESSKKFQSQISVSNKFIKLYFPCQWIDKEVIRHPVLFRDQDSLAET